MSHKVLVAHVLVEHFPLFTMFFYVFFHVFKICSPTPTLYKFHVPPHNQTSVKSCKVLAKGLIMYIVALSVHAKIFQTSTPRGLCLRKPWHMMH